VDLHARPWRQLAALSHPADLMLDTNHRPRTALVGDAACGGLYTACVAEDS
jgi:hypothetical protein